MFQFFRRNQKLTQFILFFTALTFVGGFALLTGGTDQLNFQAQNIVAEVNGTKIKAVDLSREYARMLDQVNREFGDQVDQDMLEQLNLREQALQQLVLREVLVQRAQEIGLRAGDEEVFDTIKDIPAFKDDKGKFDPKKYKSVLRQLGARMNAEAFEKSQRQSLLVSKLQDYVGSSVVVTPEEALQHFIKQSTTVDAYVLSFAPVDYIEQGEASQEAMEAYYEEHRDEFKTGKQYKVDYVRVSPTMVMAEEPTDTDLQAFFNKNKSKYDVAEAEADAQHILINTKGLEGAERDAAKAKAEALLARAKNGEDFAALAAENSDDPGSAAQGGSLGQFAKGRMVKPFEEAVFGNPAGSIVGPIETSFGYHVIKINARLDPGAVEFAAVKPAVKSDYLAERQSNVLVEMQKKIEDARKQGQSLQEIATAQSLAFKQGEYKENDVKGTNSLPKELAETFSKDDLPEIGAWAEFAGIGYWLVVTDRQDSSTLSFDEIKDTIKVRVQREGAITVAAEKANEALKMLKEGQSPESIANKLGGTLRETGPVALEAESVPGFGSDENFLGTLARLNKSNPVAQTTIRVDAAFYAISLKDRSEVTLDTFRENQEQFINELRGEKQKEAWNNWVQNVRQNAEVIMYNNEVQSL